MYFNISICFRGARWSSFYVSWANYCCDAGTNKGDILYFNMSFHYSLIAKSKEYEEDKLSQSYRISKFGQ